MQTLLTQSATAFWLVWSLVYDGEAIHKTERRPKCQLARIVYAQHGHELMR